ncbi:MAG: 2-oxo-4-hydroxy-4-carboxy-5-ureidoimidazoline decarboxylase [Verrucomicrobiota bacterium]
MISLSRLNAAPDAEFVATLGGIYEHSDWVPRRIIGQRPFAGQEDLQLAMRLTVNAATAEEKLTLIRAHPDLAGKLARAGALTEASTNEQAGLGLDRLSDGEYEEFSDRNQRYREKFGFPFIICARLTTKQGVLEAFEERLGNPVEVEISEALEQIHQIARLRLIDLVGG